MRVWNVTCVIVDLRHRNTEIIHSTTVACLRMIRITGDAPSHCFALLHSRFGWNSRESSQPLSARRNAQPLGRAFTLSRDDLAFANVKSWSQISFADNECDLISISNKIRTDFERWAWYKIWKKEKWLISRLILCYFIFNFYLKKLYRCVDKTLQL